MSKNNRIKTLAVDDMTNTGLGVASDNGKVVFVKGGVRGDIAEAEIIKTTKNFDIARIKRLITPSPRREVNTCGSYKECGGCVFRHVSYEEESRAKTRHVADCLKKYAGVAILPEEIQTYSTDFYRNNIRCPIGSDKNGELFYGFYSERSHKIIKIDECLTQMKCFTPILKELFVSLNSRGFSAYDEKSGTGLLRHVCLRCSLAGKVSLCLVINGAATKSLAETAKEIGERFENLISFSLNINHNRTNVIFGGETIVLFEKERLVESVCGKRFEISPLSFFQVNTVTAEMLFNKAKEYLNFKAGEVLLDMYCGAGSVGISVLPDGAKLFGVEEYRGAVEDAKRNAELNGVGEYGFLCGDAAEGLSACEARFGRPTAIVVDPPRKGLSGKAINAIISSGAEKLLYISCNPSTLARDISSLITGGFSPINLALFDLFPRTSHVECVTLMSRAKNQV